MTVQQALDGGFRYNPAGKPEDHPKVGVTLRLRHQSDPKKHALVKILNMDELAALLGNPLQAPPVPPFSAEEIADLKRMGASLAEALKTA